MALEIKVRASLDEGSLSKIQQQLKDAGKNTKIAFQINKNEFSAAVRDALKSVKNTKLTISKIEFSQQAKQQLTEIKRYYQEKAAAESQMSKTNSELFLAKKNSSMDQMVTQWEKNKEALEDYKVHFEKLQQLYASADTPKQLQLVNQEFKQLKISTDDLIRVERQRSQERQRSASQAEKITREETRQAQQARAESEKATRAEAQNQIAQVKAKKAMYDVEVYMQKNTKAASKYRTELEGIKQGYERIAKGGTKEQLAEQNAQWGLLQSKIKAAGDAGKTFGDQMKHAFDIIKSYFSVTRLIMEFIQKLREAYNNVKNIDTAMVNLKKVTDESARSYSEYLSRAGSEAVEVGRTVSGLVEAAAKWAKLGYSIEEAEKLSQVSAVFANVAELSDDEAVTDLVTAMKAFNIEAENSIEIADKLNELGNNFATDAAALGDGLARSASALQVAGNDINQTLALITGGTEITQDAQTMSNSLKVISMRIRGMKGALEELGEEYENVESISKIQTQILNLTKGKINIFDDYGNFRSTYDILKDISEIYNDLVDTDKASLTEILFGKLRANQGVALLTAFQSGQIEKAYETAVNSTGSAMKEQAKQMDSIQGKTAQLSAAWEKLSNDMMSSQGLKSAIDFLRKLLDGFDWLINNVGKLGTALAAFSGIEVFQMIKNGGTASLDAFVLKTKNLVTNFGNLWSGEANMTQMKAAVEIFNNGVMSGEQYAKVIEKAIPGTGAYFKTLQRGDATVQGLTASYEEQGHRVVELSIKQKVLATTTQILKSAFVGLAFALASLVIRAVINEIKDLIQTSQELHEAVLENIADGEKISDIEDSVNSAINKFEEYRKKLLDVDTSTEDLNKTKSELLDLQNNLIQTYGDEVDGISLVNGYYQDQIELLENLRKEQRQTWLDNNLAQYNSSVKDLETQSQLKGSMSIALNYVSAAKGNKFVEQYLKENGIDVSKLFSVGTEAYDEYKKVLKVLSQQSLNIQNMSEDQQKALNRLKEETSKYIAENEEEYKNYKKIQDWVDEYRRTAALVSDQSDLFLSISKNVEELNEAADNYDTDRIREIYLDIFANQEIFNDVYDSMSEEVQKAFEKLFDDIDKDKTKKASQYAGIISRFVASREAEGISGINVYDFLSGELNGYDQKTIAWYSQLKRVINDSGFTLSDFVEKLREVGIIAGETATESIQSFSDYKAEVESVIQSIATVGEIAKTSGTLTTEKYREMIAVSGDYQNALRYEADGIKFDSKQINAITKSRAEETKATIKQKQAIDKLNYHELHKKLKQTYEDYSKLNDEQKELYKRDLEELLTISNQITQYDLLISQLDEATNALTNYTNAKAESAYSAEFNVASDAYRSLVAGFESGKVGTKEFEAAVEALVPKSEIDKGISNIYDYFEETLGRYFKYDESGNIMAEGLQNFVQAGLDSALFTGTVDDWYVSEGIKIDDIAERLNITREAVISFFGAIEEYGYGVNFTFWDEFLDGASDDIVRLEQLEDQLAADRMKLIDEGEYYDSNGKLTEAAKENIEHMQEVVSAQKQLGKNLADNLLNQEQTLQELTTASTELEAMLAEGSDATAEEISEKLLEVQALKDKLVEPTEINVQFAADAIQSEIDALQSQLDDLSLPESVRANIQAQIEELEGKKEAVLSLETSDAEGSIEEIQRKYEALAKEIANGNAVNIDNSQAIQKIQAVRNLVATLKRELGEASTISVQNGGTSTIRNNGGKKSYATGTLGAPQTGSALVGEQGTEMLVRGNHWSLIGRNGAEFTNVRKGDIIFDANQTEHLLRSGKVSSRGMSFAHGTAGQAFVQGYSGSFSGYGVKEAAEDVEEALDGVSDAIEDAADDFSDSIDEIEILLNDINKQAERLSSIQELYETYRNQNKVIDKQLDVQKQLLSSNTLALEKYSRLAESVELSDEWKSKVIGGDFNIEEITDESLSEAIKKFQEFYEKAEACKDSIIGINKELHDLSLQKLDNIENDFGLVDSRLNAIISKQEAIISLNERIGNSATENDWQKVLENQRLVTNNLAGELEQLEAEFQRQVNSGAIVAYDDCWYEWQTTIENTRKELASATEGILDSVDKIRSIRWQPFENAISDLDDMDDELKHILNLIGDVPLFNDDGKMTNAGKTTLGIYTQQLKTAKKRTAEYENAIEALKKDLDNGNISQTTYNELLKKYSNAQKKAIEDTKSAEDAIIKLKIQGIDKATEAYKKYVDIQKQDLQAKKKYDDYLDKINDKNDEINAIRSQISALQGDEKNATKIKKLNSQLLKLQDEYNDIRTEHEYEMLVEGYDKQLEAFTENQEAEKTLIDTDLEYREKKIDEEAAYTKYTFDDIYNYIIMLSEVYKTNVTPQLTSPWNNSVSAVDNYKQAINGVSSSVTILTSSINTSTTVATNTMEATEKRAEELVTNGIATTKLQTSNMIDEVGSNLNKPWNDGQSSVNGYKDAVDGVGNSVSAVGDVISSTLSETSEALEEMEKETESWLASVVKAYNTSTTAATTGTVSNQIQTGHTSIKNDTQKKSVASVLNSSKSTVNASTPYVEVPVQTNDTLYSIATRYGVDAEDLEKKNGISKGQASNKLAVSTIKVPITQKTIAKALFASGGIVELAHSVGEDGIAFVKNGEAIIAPDQVNAVKALAENAASLNELLDRVPSGGVGGTINISYGSLINEYNASAGENSREVTQLFRKLFDNEMKRLGNYSRQLGLI